MDLKECEAKAKENQHLPISHGSSTPPCTSAGISADDFVFSYYLKIYWKKGEKRLCVMLLCCLERCIMGTEFAEGACMCVCAYVNVRGGHGFALGCSFSHAYLHTLLDTRFSMDY